jgi:hypothetical protein
VKPESEKDSDYRRDDDTMPFLETDGDECDKTSSYNMYQRTDQSPADQYLEDVYIVMIQDIYDDVEYIFHETEAERDEDTKQNQVSLVYPFLFIEQIVAGIVFQIFFCVCGNQVVD